MASGEIESADEEEIVSSMTAFQGLMGSLLNPLKTGNSLDSSEIRGAVDDFFVGGRKKEEEERLESEYIISKNGKLLLLFVRAAKALTEGGRHI